MAVEIPTQFIPKPDENNQTVGEVPVTKTPTMSAEDTAALTEPKDIGYFPNPTQVPDSPDGSVFMATLQESTSWGSFIGSSSARIIGGDDQPSPQAVMDMIPSDLLENYFDRYAGKHPDDFPKITKQIRDEIERRELISAYPVRSFAYGLLQQPFDPLNWVTAGEFVKAYRIGENVLQGASNVGISALASSAGQEAIIQANSLTRESKESFYNIAANGIVGATLGAIGTGANVYLSKMGREALTSRERLTSQVRDVLTETETATDDTGRLTPDALANMPEVIKKSMVLSGANRLSRSDFATANHFAQTILDNNYTTERHLSGDTLGPNTERAIIAQKRKLSSHLIDYQNIYYESIGINKGPFKSTRAKLNAPEKTFEQWDQEVSYYMTTNDVSPDESVNKAAAFLRKNIWDETTAKLIELEKLPKGITPKNADKYLMTVYNKDRIIETGGREARSEGSYPPALFKYFKGVQEELKLFKESPFYKLTNEEIAALKTKLAKAEDAKKKIKPDNKTKLKQAREKIKALKEEIAGKENEILDKAPLGSVTSKGKLRRIQTDQELWASVGQTVDNILGDTAGQLVNPILSKLGTGKTKPLHPRKILADQLSMRDWHVTSASKLTDMYIRATTPIIELETTARQLGYKDFEAMRLGYAEQLKAEFDRKSKGLTGKEAQKLRKQRDEAAADMANSFDILLGIYGDGPNVLNKSAQEFYRNFLKWNYVRLLGFMTISSFADAGIQVFTHGPYRVIREGLMQSFSEVRKLSKQDLKAIGYVNETLMGTRLKSFIESEGLTVNPGPFTKGMDALANNFGNFALMNQWNDWHQSMAGHMSISRTLETIAKLQEGKKVSKKDRTRLARLGIEEKYFPIIYDFTKDNVSDGARFADWGNWELQSPEQAEALRQFQLSVSKEIDSVVIAPTSGDKIQYGFLDANTTLGKFILQFKTFLSAATNRVFYAGLQRTDDAFLYSGVMSMLAFGALSYVTASLLKGKEPDLSFTNLAREAVDKSGMLGIFGELPNIGAKLLGFEGPSRYQSRDVVGGMIGPSSGAISEMVQLLSKIRASATDSSVSLTTKDYQKALRLMPLQNLFYLNYLNQQVVKELALYSGAEEPPQR